MAQLISELFPSIKLIRSTQFRRTKFFANTLTVIQNFNQEVIRIGAIYCKKLPVINKPINKYLAIIIWAINLTKKLKILCEFCSIDKMSIWGMAY